MDTIDKTLSMDIDLGTLLGALDGIDALPLVFRYDGRSVRPGYHVTEVKSGRFDALDCGANPESWTEIFIQLWDVDDEGRTHMPAGKFSAIVRKVSERVGLPRTARLTFEVSDGIQPMQLYCASLPSRRSGGVDVELLPRSASCKPRDRWLAESTAEAAACCAPAASDSSCCR